jgi:predicted Zn-dependent protease
MCAAARGIDDRHGRVTSLRPAAAAHDRRFSITGESAMPPADDLRPTTPHDKPVSTSEPFPKAQLDFDIAFYDRILKRQPDYVDVLRCQGELLSRRGLHERALVIDRRLAELLPHDFVIRYNLACSLAVGGFRREAIVALRAALENGYDDFEYLETDSDLDTLRDDPAYRALMREYGILN